MRKGSTAPVALGKFAGLSEEERAMRIEWVAEMVAEVLNRLLNQPLPTPTTAPPRVTPDALAQPREMGESTSDHATAGWPDNPCFTEEELSQLTGISTRQLQQLRHDGLLPYSKPGKSVFYTREDWETCLQRTRRPGVDRDTLK